MNDQVRVALVTGAGTGIGRASALALARRGFHLALTGRRPDPLEDTAAAIAAEGGRVLTVPADVSNEDAVAQLFERIAKEFGRLDLLFNNAGGNVGRALISDLSLQAWNSVIGANLTGSFLCARAAFRMMMSQDPPGGRIINNGSLSAHVPRPASLAYTVSKHGVTGLTKQLALDGRRYGIACGQIDVGNAATAGSGASALTREQPDGTMQTEATISPDAVANAVIAMADLPLDVNILTLTVMATTIPYVGRG
ncbi:MAG TPA: SDR family oxidoreductase [Acidothermaceae bacterium]|jgi:NAD(P)-dependent dehydrogenase (short-subunit alcohol dehydrogenase family)